MSANPLLRAADGPGETLGHVAARLGPALAVRLSALANDDLLLAPGPIVSGDYVTWLGDRSEPGTCYRFRQALTMIVSVDPLLAGALLAGRFGGVRTGEPKPLGRAGAAIAREIADAVAGTLLALFPVIGGDEDRVHDNDIAAAGFARGSDKVATLALQASDAKGELGRIALAFPLAGIARLAGDDAKPPRVEDALTWQDDLRSGMLGARMPVRAILARPELPATTIAALAVGDVVPIPKPGAMPLLVGQHRIATCALDERDGRSAVRIERLEMIPHE